MCVMWEKIMKKVENNSVGKMFILKCGGKKHVFGLCV